MLALSNFTTNKSFRTTVENSQICPQSSPDSAAVSSKKPKLIGKWELIDGKLVRKWIVGKDSNYYGCLSKEVDTAFLLI